MSFLLISVTGMGQQGSLEQVIRAHQETIPLQKFIAFKTYYWEGVITQNEVMKINFQLSQEKGKALMVMDMGATRVVQGIDLREMKPWTIGPDGKKIQITDPATIGGLVGFANPFGDLGGETMAEVKNRYTELKYVGMESVDGVNYHIIRSTDTYGTKKKYFIHSQTNNLEMTETSAGGVTALVKFSHFVTQEGVTMPWKYAIESGQSTMIFHITKLELGKEMDPDQYRFN